MGQEGPDKKGKGALGSNTPLQDGAWRSNMASLPPIVSYVILASAFVNISAS